VTQCDTKTEKSAKPKISLHYHYSKFSLFVSGEKFREVLTNTFCFRKPDASNASVSAYHASRMETTTTLTTAEASPAGTGRTVTGYSFSHRPRAARLSTRAIINTQVIFAFGKAVCRLQSPEKAPFDSSPFPNPNALKMSLKTYIIAKEEGA
jgi:hypothetical protein